MNTKFQKNFKDDSFLDDSQKNFYIKVALKELLYDVVQNTSKYTTEKFITRKTQHIALKEITYILVNSISEFLVWAFDSEIKITSTFNAKLILKRFITANISKLKFDENYQGYDYTILDVYLNKLYKHDKVSNDPIIQFMFWSIKSIPRLCIDPKKEFLAYDVTVILKNYFDNVFYAIDEYNKNSSKMTSSEIRNFLSSTFIDRILISEYYQKIFE